MLSSDDSVTRPLNDPDGTMAPTTQRHTRQLPYVPVTTTQLPAQRVTITTPLSAHGTVTITRLPTVIPATQKRARIPQATHAHHRPRPMVLVGVMLCSLIILVAVSLFVTPLDDNGQHQTIAGALGGAINNFISTGSLSSFAPSQQAAPTAAPIPTFTGGSGSCNGATLWQACATEVTASGVMGTGQMQHPLQGAVITQVFGHLEYQTWCGCWKPHTGIDLASPYGTPVMAADSGQVIWTGWDISGLGWAVKINHGHYIATVYGHLARFIVNVGQNVTKGQVLGYEGSTGASTGPHVHFMVVVNNSWVDPTLYVQLP
jgi:Peptidase family M23